MTVDQLVIMAKTRAFLQASALRSGRMSIEDSLFRYLECPYHSPGAPAGIAWELQRNENRTVIQESLLALFIELVGAMEITGELLDLGQILCGMGRAECWERLIIDETKAYLLASGLVGYIEGYQIARKASPFMTGMASADNNIHV